MPDATSRSTGAAASPAPDGDRLPVRKTYQLFINGAFAPSESGRSYRVRDTNAGLASGQDLARAVTAARAAGPQWAGSSAYHRGRLLYRVAELLEGRGAEFGALGVPAEAVATAVDRWVWYAGWCDKIAQWYGGANPVAGPYLSFSVPEPVGVAGIVAPPDSPLLGLVSVLAPALVTGNTVVLLAPVDEPRPAIVLAEVFAAAGLPVGVVNVLSGRLERLTPELAGHADLSVLDLTGVTDSRLVAALEQTAAGTRQRVIRPPAQREDWAADPDINRMAVMLKTKTVWHPTGL